MGYSGQTYGMPLTRGGINNIQNYDQMAPFEMLPTSRNWNFTKGGRKRRGGTTRVTAEIDSGARIYGLFDYLKPGGTQYQVLATSTKIYKDATNTIKTSWTASKYVWFSQFAGELYACNGVDMPEKWTGSGQMATLTDTPTDWDTANNKPKYMVTHGRGVSERNWAFGCGATPTTLYISPNDDGDDFSDANVKLLLVDTKDGYGIVGAVPFQDRFIVFGKSKAFIIDDADPDSDFWGYYEAAWEAGVAHQKLLVKTPNDLVAVTENLDIYSVVAAERYSDYKQASLARPAYIDEWLRENVAVAYLDDCHAIYDPKLRAIKFFFVRTGQTEIDTCLVYFIDRPPEEAWSIHNSDATSSGYDASCSALVRVGIGNWEVYTGDYSGYIWKLEQSTRLDNAETYATQFKTPPHAFGDLRSPKDFRKGRLILNPQGTEVASINWWVDGAAGTQRSVTATSGVYDYEFDLGAKGRRLQYQVICSASNADYLLTDILTDYKQLGRKPI